MAHKNKTNISPYKTRQEAKGRKTSPESSPTSPKTAALRGTHKRPESIYTTQEANDRLYDIFKNHDFGFISHEERLKLAQFYVLLMENQKKENFTRLLNFRDIAIKHFIDCRIITTLTKLQFPLMDMGTGPGFPGIPLKLAFPEEKIVLAEGVQRRVEFLKHVREELALKNLVILGRNINPFCAYPVKGIITRAVEDVRNTLKNGLTCLDLGGRIYLMKGPGVDPEIQVAQEEIGEFYKLVEDHHYFLPKTQHERRLLVYEKIKPAPLLDFEDEPWPGEFDE
jgi:16S rRNA (guanine527-N7)-methyltransferase